jgi:DNA primase
MKRQDHIESKPASIMEVERVLLRALAITQPDFAAARRLAVEAVTAQPAYFEHLGTFICLQALAARTVADPMDAVEDPAQRAFLAQVLFQEVDPPAETEVRNAIQQIEERALESQRRAIIALIAEAETRGDFAEVVLLTQQKMALDRKLRELHNR